MKKAKEKYLTGVFVSATFLWQTAALVALSSPEIHVSMSNGPRGAHTLDGEFELSASSATAWDVLTDYDSMPRFVSSVKSSRIVRRDRDATRVEQNMTGKTGIFRKRIFLSLDVREFPPSKILFRDQAGISFKTYEGQWSLESRNDGKIFVRYHLTAVPAFFSPDFLTLGAFKKTVKSLLEEVRMEITRRQDKISAVKIETPTYKSYGGQR